MFYVNMDCQKIWGGGGGGGGDMVKKECIWSCHTVSVILA